MTVATGQVPAASGWPIRGERRGRTGRREQGYRKVQKNGAQKLTWKIVARSVARDQRDGEIARLEIDRESVRATR